MRAVLLAFFLTVHGILAAPDGIFHPFVAGITAEPLPVDLPNVNNLLYRHDGTLVALGYAGDIYLLTDSDGDGVEDHVTVFYKSEGRLTGQIGMDLAPKGSPHGNAVFLAAKGKIVMIADRDGDDRADVVQTLADGWPPARAGVDVTGLALHPTDGSVWFGLGVRLYNDAYEIEETGTAQNDLSGERGSILRIAPDFQSREKICTGIRWPIALRFNRHGDLFCTDQEGATWLPNGNPYDELLHIEAGRHYGFPPRHPKHLPDVIDEPSVYDYGPQHQSTCGMNFNESVHDGPVFGPPWWAGDALVVGESRGKLYRTKLVKTAAGYVAHNEIIAGIGALAIDACVSPFGELRLCAHSGDPDWGTGPKGKGTLWRIRYTPKPQPVMAWRESPSEVRVAFDRPIAPSADQIHIEASPHARAGDRYESFAPGYEVVKAQQAEGRRLVEVHGVRMLSENSVAIQTETLAEQTWLSVDLPEYALQANAHGVRARWSGEEDAAWEGWLPHVDLDVSRAFLHSSALYSGRFADLQEPGVLTVTTQLDLWQMLHPAIQKGAHLDYQYAPETVTVTFASTTGPLTLRWGNQYRTSTRGHVSHDVSLSLTVTENRWVPITLTLDHPGEGPPALTASWSTMRDRRARAFPTRRFVQPWTTPDAPPVAAVPVRPETQGGSWARGKALYFGEKALCSHCHAIRGTGQHLGPDLSNLPFRDYASVWRDIMEPSASLNPDYPTHQVTLVSGETLVAVPVDQGDGSVRLGLGPGVARVVPKEAVANAQPLAQSLMPVGLLDNLTKDEQRDLMTFLLHEAPVMQDYPSLPRDGVDDAPSPRTQSELEAVLEGAPAPSLPTRPLKVVLVAGKKDHGHGEHDYPRWQQVWGRLLSMGAKTSVGTAWEWPSQKQWSEADVLVFFKRGNWTPARCADLRAYLERGGGAVFIHWACEAGGHAEMLGEIIGLASDAGQTHYRHGLVDVRFAQGAHPITRGFSQTRFHDESYWNLVGDLSDHTLLADCEEDGGYHPQFWAGAVGEGRVFVSIPGHYSWTFDDPLFRVLLLRGMAWSAQEPVDRWNNLIDAGIELND